jgi:nucleoid-associated protein YgaU
MTVREKYHSLIDLAYQGGITDLEVTEEGDVLRITGTAPSEDVKNRIWEEYGRIDPEARSGDLVLNLQVGGEEQTYTVASGDTLSAIGQRHGVAWREIFEANRDVIGDNPDLIKPGQKLRIPKK